MAATLFASGTQTIGSLNNEYFLGSVGVAGTYICVIDTSALSSSDILVMKLYYTVLSGGTPYTYTTYTIVGAQADPIFISDPLPTDLVQANTIRFSINQTGGTARSFPWKILQL
jgi:hypothetical protein